MIRNLKVLATALAATFALSATVVSAAESGQFTAGEFLVALTGEQINFGEHPSHVFTAGNRSIECKVTKFDATMTANAKTLTVTPTYEECNSGPFPVTVTMNGCYYEFNEPTKEAATFTGTLNWLCPQPLLWPEFHIYKKHAELTEGKSLCTVTVTPFVGLGTNEYTNVEGSPDYVRVTTKMKGVPIHIHSNSPLLCGTGTSGTYTGATALRAYKDGLTHVEANQVSTTVS